MSGRGTVLYRVIYCAYSSEHKKPRACEQAYYTKPRTTEWDLRHLRSDGGPLPQTVDITGQ